MATIQKRTSKDGRVSYRVMVRLKGRPAEYATFTRKTDAAKWAQQTEAAIREGRHFKTREAKRHTFSEAVERYSREILSRKPKAKREDQDRHLKWWESQIGSYTLADVTPALLAEQRETLSREITHYGRERSAATVNRYLISLSHVFTLAAREWGWMEQNPARKVSKLKEPRGRVRFLSDEERRRLLEACRESSNPRLYPLVLLALSTGARRGELLELQWPDVDLQRGTAVLHETKNRQRRAIPITGTAREVLRQLGRIRRVDTDRIFAGPKGKATFPRTAWEGALEAAGIERDPRKDLQQRLAGRGVVVQLPQSEVEMESLCKKWGINRGELGFSFHDLRHSAASYLAMSGATLAEIAEVLGHKTLAMVRRYSHLTEAHTAGVVARMNKRFLAEP